jgi:hypothetical protein
MVQEETWGGRAAVDLITPMAVRVAATLRVADAITPQRCIAGSACEMGSLVVGHAESREHDVGCAVQRRCAGLAWLPRLGRAHE